MISLELLYKLRSLKENSQLEFVSVFAGLPRDTQEYLAQHWYFGTARFNQIIPWHENWRQYIIKPGRGFGKNWMASRNIIDYAFKHPGCRINCYGRTASECNDVMVVGESGLEPAFKEIGVELIPGNSREWPKKATQAIYLITRDHAQIRMHNKTLIRFYGASKTRGRQSHLTYVDELFTWFETETHREKKLEIAYQELMTITRLGDNPRMLITSTPQPVKILKQMYERSKAQNDITIISGSTFDNPYLSEAYKKELLDAFGNTRRGQQELYGMEQWEVPGALWKESDILRSKNTEDLVKILVAIDPACSNNKNSDETGIVVVGRKRDKTYYVLEDISGKYSPAEWAKRAIDAYNRWEANLIVYESNQGGDMVAETIKNVKKTVPLKAVRASKGKYARAEPIAALYEQHKVYHVGVFNKLEEQMLSYNPEFYSSSPDRLDALVWGLHELSKRSDYNVSWV